MLIKLITYKNIKILLRFISYIFIMIYLFFEKTYIIINIGLKKFNIFLMLSNIS